MLDGVVDKRKTSLAPFQMASMKGIYTYIRCTYTSEHKYNMCVDKTWTLLATLGQPCAL
jgi:hypothetical protein